MLEEISYGTTGKMWSEAKSFVSALIFCSFDPARVVACLAALATTDEAFHIDLIARLCEWEEALSHADIDLAAEYLLENSFDHYTT